MVKPATDLQVLHALCLEIAPIISGRAEALSASLDVRCARAAWQAALNHLGMSEAEARERSSPAECRAA